MECLEVCVKCKKQISPFSKIPPNAWVRDIDGEYTHLKCYYDGTDTFCDKFWDLIYIIFGFKYDVFKLL